MGNYDDDKREILKIKQGLISDIEQPEQSDKTEPQVKPRLKDQLYSAKWALPLILIAAAMVVIMIVQSASRTKEDLRVLIITSSPGSELTQFSQTAQSVKTALENICPDYDGSGKIYVEPVYIDVSDVINDPTYLNMQYERFQIEIKGTAMLVLADCELLERVNSDFENKISAFIDFSDEFPEDKLYKGCGVRIAGTSFAEDISCENSVLFVRDELGNGREEKSAQYRDRAVEVLNKIVGEAK